MLVNSNLTKYAVAYQHKRATTTTTITLLAEQLLLLSNIRQNIRNVFLTTKQQQQESYTNTHTHALSCHLRTPALHCWFATTNYRWKLHCAHIKFHWRLVVKCLVGMTSNAPQLFIKPHTHTYAHKRLLRTSCPKTNTINQRHRHAHTSAMAYTCSTRNSICGVATWSHTHTHTQAYYTHI